MARIRAPEMIDHRRRSFLEAAALTTIAAAELGMIGSAQAQSDSAAPANPSAIKPGTNTSFGPLKQIDAGVLNVGYAEAGPADGPPVILLHGWPYDIHTYVDVAPLLAAKGYRVIVPYLRGYGTTRFLSDDDDAQRPAVGARRRHHRADGCAGDRKGHDRRLRLGRAHRQHRRRALAGALQGDGLGERLSDRQPGSSASCRCRRRPSCNGGISTTSPPSAAAPATRNTRAISPGSSGSSRRRSGTSTMPPSSAARRPSTIRITSPS